MAFCCWLPSYPPKHFPGLEIRFLTWLPVCTPSSSLPGLDCIWLGPWQLTLTIFSSMSSSCSCSPYHGFTANCNWMVWKNSLPLTMELREPRYYQLTFTYYCCLKTIATVFLLWDQTSWMSLQVGIRPEVTITPMHILSLRTGRDPQVLGKANLSPLVLI